MDYNLNDNMLEVIAMTILTVSGCALVWRGFFSKYWNDSGNPHWLAAILAVFFFVFIVLASALMTLIWFVALPAIGLIGLLAWFRKRRLND